MGDFDGIKEREEGEKRMPFAMAIAFIGLALFGLSYIYFFIPHTTGWTQVGQFEKRMRDREAAALTHKEEDEPVEHELKEAEDIGKKIYAADCAVCHGEGLEGGVGPALTGPKFKYGGRLEDHVRVTSKGTDEGMPGFESQLGKEKIHAVAMFIHKHPQHKH